MTGFYIAMLNCYSSFIKHIVNLETNHDKRNQITLIDYHKLEM